MSKRYDVTGAIIAFETGSLGDAETVELFAHLVRTGMAWTLQGSYGRAAARLIEGGILSREGVILREVA